MGFRTVDWVPFGGILAVLCCLSPPYSASIRLLGSVRFVDRLRWVVGELMCWLECEFERLISGASLIGESPSSTILPLVRKWNGVADGADALIRLWWRCKHWNFWVVCVAGTLTTIITTKHIANFYDTQET